MRILLGIQGTGYGHVVRCQGLVRELRALGHEVQCILSSRDRSTLLDDKIFEPLTVFRGLTGFARRGRARFLYTAANLGLIKFFREASSYDTSGIDLIVTDFEPVTAWLGRFRGIPTIGISHLYAYSYPIRAPRRSFLFQPLMRLTIPVVTPVKWSIGLHWHHFGHPILPPSIPRDVVQDRPVKSGKILVYLAWESEDRVRALLRSFPDHQFFIYRNTPQPSDDGNLHFRPPGRALFLRDLLESEGVVANAGFTLASEALHLGKKVMLKPIQGHFEHHFNVKALEYLKLGTALRRLDQNVFDRWLESPSPRPMAYPDVIRPFCQWVDDGNWDDPSELAQRCWRQVSRAEGSVGREPPETSRTSPREVSTAGSGAGSHE